jgi:hypothetical protein
VCASGKTDIIEVYLTSDDYCEDDPIDEEAQACLAKVARCFKLETSTPTHVALMLAACCIGPSVRFNFDYGPPFLECLVPPSSLCGCWLAHQFVHRSLSPAVLYGDNNVLIDGGCHQ